MNTQSDNEENNVNHEKNNIEIDNCIEDLLRPDDRRARVNIF
jgi:hypothetical protein